MKKLGHKAKTLLMSALVVMAMAVPAFAAEGDLNSALTTGLTSASSSIMGTLATVLPIALGILAAIFGVKYGIRFFKQIAKG